MSARLLKSCLAPAALLAAGLLAPGLARPADRPCACHHAKAKLISRVYNVADLVVPITAGSELHRSRSAQVVRRHSRTSRASRRRSPALGDGQPTGSDLRSIATADPGCPFATTFISVATATIAR